MSKTSLEDIDRKILEFLGARPVKEDPDCYELPDDFLRRVYLHDVKFYYDWKNLMDVLNFVENLGYDSLIQNNVCTLLPRLTTKIKVSHTEMRDTKQWAIYHCIHSFITKYKNEVERLTTRVIC